MSDRKTSTYQGAPPKYLNDFSKALAGEVRILLAEVGKLRDERRQLQYEIAELMAVKSKHGSGGEYAEGWGPGQGPPPGSPGPPAAPPPEEAPAGPARPAWRVVHKRPERTGHGKKKASAGASPAAPQAAIEAPKPDLPAWAQWRPNPLLSPAPQQATGSSPLPAVHPGIFGPPTPPPQ